MVGILLVSWIADICISSKVEGCHGDKQYLFVLPGSAATHRGKGQPRQGG